MCVKGQGRNNILIRSTTFFHKPRIPVITMKIITILKLSFRSSRLFPLWSGKNALQVEVKDSCFKFTKHVSPFFGAGPFFAVPIAYKRLITTARIFDETAHFPKSL